MQAGQTLVGAQTLAAGEPQPEVSSAGGEVAGSLEERSLGDPRILLGKGAVSLEDPREELAMAVTEAGAAAVALGEHLDSFRLAWAVARS